MRTQKAIDQYLEECGTTCFCGIPYNIKRDHYDWWPKEDNQPEGPQTVDFGVRFGVIPEPTFPAQPYPGWDGRDYTVIDEDHIVSRGGEAYLFTHRTPPDAGFNYEVRDTLKRQDLPEKLEGTLVSTQENHDPRNHASIIIREIPREVVAQMGEERAKRLHSDSRLVRVA